MNPESYLRRMNLGRVEPPSAGFLAALQAAHLASVPFENLDIRGRVPITLDLARIYAKVVERRRGGFCYELNGLFHWLLAKLGFRPRMISARVYDSARRSFGPEYDHLAILVDADGVTWLTDVGFGEFASRPIPLDPPGTVADRSTFYRCETASGGRFVAASSPGPDGPFTPEYDFSPEERPFREFAGMCRHHQTSPDSHFTRGRLCSLLTSTGRITLTDRALIVTSEGGRIERPVNSEEEFRSLLRERFGIVLPEGEVDAAFTITENLP